MKSSKFPFFTSSEGRSSAYVHKGQVFVFGKIEAQLGIGENKNIPVALKESFNGGKLVKISFGDGHGIVCTSKQEVFAYGTNNRGQLGLGDKSRRREFTLVKALERYKIVDVSCGWFHSVFRTKNSGVFSTGFNSSYQLGINSNKRNVLTPLKVIFKEDFNVKDIKCGNCYTIFLSESGMIYKTGCINRKFEKIVYLPQRITDLSQPFSSIAGGHEHFFALTATGKVWAYGNNNSGQLAFSNGNKFIKGNKSKMVLVSSLEKHRITAISCGYWYTYFLSDNGTMLGVGGSSSGELAYMDIGKRKRTGQVRVIAKEVAQIHGSGHNGAYIDLKGNVYVTGTNYNGELGLPDTNMRVGWVKNTHIPTLERLKIKRISRLFTLLKKKVFLDVTFLFD